MPVNKHNQPQIRAIDKHMERVMVRALNNIDKPAPRSLVEHLHSDSLTLRHTAAQILGERRDRRAVRHLLRALQDDSGEVRRAAAWALGEIGDSRAVPALTRALRDIDDRQSWVIAAEFIEPYFDDGEYRSHKRVCDFAAEALAKIGSPQALDALVAWRQGYELE